MISVTSCLHLILECLSTWCLHWQYFVRGSPKKIRNFKATEQLFYLNVSVSKRRTSNRDWAEEAVDMETLVQWDGRGECDHLNLYGRHVIAVFDKVHSGK